MKHKHFKQMITAAAAISCLTLTSSQLTILADETPARIAPSADTYILSLENAVPQGSYSLYRLFTGSFDPAGSTMMGDAVVNEDLKSIIETALKTNDPSLALSGSTADQANQMTGAISAIAAGTNGDVNVQKLANEIADAIQKGSIAPLATQNASADGTLSFEGLPSGYYLVISNPGEAYQSGNGAMTRAILVTLSQNTTIKTKTTGLTDFDKEAIVDGKPVKLADVSIQDGKVITPSYSISADVAGLYQYDHYPLIFTDTLPAGLTTDTAEVAKDWNVSITASNGTETKDLTSAFTPTVQSSDGVSTLDFTCNELKAALTQAGFTADQVNGFDSKFTITLSYTPVYDAADIQAMFSAPGSLKTPFVNSAKAIFPDNPYDKGDSSVKPDGTPDPDKMSKTPSSTVNTYSYSLQIHKIGPDQKALTGAKFALSLDGESAGHDVTASDDGTFTFTGLAAGKSYTLSETQVPAGMQQIDPITFTIAENPDETGTVIASINGTLTSDPDKAAVLDVQDSSIVLTVTNLAGHALPNTGMGGMSMMGLSALAAGGGLVLLLVSRKKR